MADVSTPPRERLIAHLDMDAFYASVELLRYPELRGCPLVIGGGHRHAPRESIDAVTGTKTRTFSKLADYAGRGVITTATYEARALGLHSAMGLMKAAALAPQTVLLPVDFDAYRRHSHMFKAAVATIATEIEDRGIDEIYIDLTDVPPPLPFRAPGRTDDDAWLRATAVARAIKRAVHTATGLTCSIAIARNKLLAKIASELDKPDGLTVLRDEDVERRIWPLAARKINGVGPKTGARLEALGIRTIGDLARADRDWLIGQFGMNQATWLQDAAHGRDERAVVTFSEPKSISRELTFDRDLDANRDRDALSRIFTELCDGVGDDLRRKGYVCKTIGLKIRYSNFKTVTRDCTIEMPTQDSHTIHRVAGDCLKRVSFDRRIRLLGVRVAGLAEASSPPSQVIAAEPKQTLFD